MPSRLNSLLVYGPLHCHILRNPDTSNFQHLKLFRLTRQPCRVASDERHSTFSRPHNGSRKPWAFSQGDGLGLHRLRLHISLHRPDFSTFDVFCLPSSFPHPPGLRLEISAKRANVLHSGTMDRGPSAINRLNPVMSSVASLHLVFRSSSCQPEGRHIKEGIPSRIYPHK